MIKFLLLSYLSSEIILASNLKIYWSLVNNLGISFFGGLGWSEYTFPKLSSGDPYPLYGGTSWTIALFLLSYIGIVSNYIPNLYL